MTSRERSYTLTLILLYYIEIIAIFTQNKTSLFDCKTAYLHWFYWRLSHSSRQSLKFCCSFRIGMMLPGPLTGRLSCGRSETGQTNRQQCEPRRPSTQRTVYKSRDSTAVPSAPIFKPPVQCPRKLASDFRLRYLFPK